MKIDLGEFEGDPIVAQTIKLTQAGDGWSDAMAIHPTVIHKGDEIDLLIRAKATNVLFSPHKDNPDHWVRANVLVAKTITILDMDVAEDLIVAQDAAIDARKGRVRIPFGAPVDKGDVVHADDSGVVLTAAEVAERLGITAVTVHVGISSAIVVYTDGQKFIWPDDYADGVGLPDLGQPLAPGDDGLVVVDLLDAATGKSVVDADQSDDVSEDGPDLFDDWSDPEPVRDLDPAAIAYVDCTVADLKAKVAGQMSRQLLCQALEAENAGKGRAAAAVAIVARIDDLAAS